MFMVPMDMANYLNITELWNGLKFVGIKACAFLMMPERHIKI